MDARQKLSRGRVIAIVLLVAWFFAVLWWALQPVDDAVPTGTVGTQQTSQTVKCDAPLSGEGGPTGPLPSLPAGQAYQREPCTKVHTEYRALFVADSALVVIAIALLVGVGRKPRMNPEVSGSSTGYETGSRTSTGS